MATRTRFREARRDGLRRVALHASVVAAVVTITLIGNLRVQGVEAAQRALSTPLATPAPGASPTSEGAKDWRLTAVSDDADLVGAPDGAEVVPAIYATNPDVRFVYYRRVSKWM